MQVVMLGFPVSNQKTVNTGSGAKVHTEVSCVGRSVEFKADVCLCGFFVVVNVGVVKLTFVILLKIRVGSVFLSRQNNHLFLLFCFVLEKKSHQKTQDLGNLLYFLTQLSEFQRPYPSWNFYKAAFVKIESHKWGKKQNKGGWVGMDNTVRVWHNKLKQSSSVNFG